MSARQRIQSLLLEIRRKRGEEHFDARSYLLHEPPETHHWAIQVEWIPGYGYTEVLSTKTAAGTPEAIGMEAAQRHVIDPDDVGYVKQVRKISAAEAKLYRGMGKKAR